jgi:hypothetical protein
MQKAWGKKGPGTNVPVVNENCRNMLDIPWRLTMDKTPEGAVDFIIFVWIDERRSTIRPDLS